MLYDVSTHLPNSASVLGIFYKYKNEYDISPYACEIGRLLKSQDWYMFPVLTQGNKYEKPHEDAVDSTGEVILNVGPLLFFLSVWVVRGWGSREQLIYNSIDFRSSKTFKRPWASGSCHQPSKYILCRGEVTAAVNIGWLFKSKSWVVNLSWDQNSVSYSGTYWTTSPYGPKETEHLSGLSLQSMGISLVMS